jgi:aspartate/glutamate racemase
MKKAIGIMGGMGPEATRYMYDLILKHTDAAVDQDHVHVIINSYPQVPPRTDAILKNGPSPTPFLIEIISPQKQDLGRSMEAVFGPEGIKAGHATGKPREAILSVAGSLIELGAEAIIAGCTEVPLVLGPKDISVPLIEPMKIAAEACILKAGYQLKADDLS